MGAGKPPEVWAAEWAAFIKSCEEDNNHFLADGVMHHESRELLRALHGHPGWLVTYQDGTLEPKARRVLAAAARRIVAGEPLPKEFLLLLADVIKARLSGEVTTLDAGFGLARKRGRPPQDPAVNDPIVDAFYGASYEASKAGASAEDALQAGLEAAFKANHRVSIDDFRRMQVDEADIQRRLKTTLAVLSDRGIMFKTS